MSHTLPHGRPWSKRAITILAALLSVSALPAQSPQKKPDVERCYFQPQTEFQAFGSNKGLPHLRKAVYRIDALANGNWSHCGTGFMFSVGDSRTHRAYVATCAHVTEGHVAAELRVVQSGDGPTYPVRRILTHSTEDASVLELEIPIEHQLPAAFNILTENDTSELTDRDIGLLGFPGTPGLSINTPFSACGMINQLPERYWIAYSLTTDNGASGSPVFLLDDKGLNPVVAIHAQQIRGVRRGVHVRALWDLIKPNNIPIVVPTIRDYPPPPPKPTATVQNTIVLARSGRLSEASQQIDTLIDTQRESAPWYAFCLRGAIRMHLGFAERQRNLDAEAPKILFSAIEDFDHAILLAPAERLPYLLRARACNNAGSPQRGAKPNASQEALLRWTHNLASTWIRTDKTRQERARCYYLLAFAHQYLECGDPQKEDNDIHTSLSLFPSKQAYEYHSKKFHHPAPIPSATALGDLFDEFNEIERASLARGSAYPPPSTPRTPPGSRVRLGVSGSDNNGDGVRITEVFADSPARVAGLEPGDVILTASGEKMESWARFRQVVQSSPKNARIRLHVRDVRTGRHLDVEIPLSD